jgi:signal peptidase I
MIGLFCVALLYGAVNLVSLRVEVMGDSMAPTLLSGQYLFASRLLNQPERGQVVVLRIAGVDHLIVKRVIGLPGETIEIRSQQVYIDGDLLHEAYVQQPCLMMYCPDSIWQLGQDDYFVMGDNRNRSDDSRYFGAVGREQISGLVLLRYYPVSAAGWVENE